METLQLQSSLPVTVDRVLFVYSTNHLYFYIISLGKAYVTKGIREVIICGTDLKTGQCKASDVL